MYRNMNDLIQDAFQDQDHITISSYIFDLIWIFLGKLPKNCDPKATPDPERWLPMKERSYYRGKKKGKKKEQIGKGTQGTTAGASAELWVVWPSLLSFCFLRGRDWRHSQEVCLLNTNPLTVGPAQHEDRLFPGLSSSWFRVSYHQSHTCFRVNLCAKCSQDDPMFCLFQWCQ